MNINNKKDKNNCVKIWSTQVNFVCKSQSIEYQVFIKRMRT